MPTFQYCAYGARGEVSKGTVDAISTDAASDVLWRRGLTPFEMREVDQQGQRWWQRDLLGGRNPARANLVSFTREFATLNSAEIPLDDALRIVCDQLTSAKMRAVVKSLLDDVLNGSTLSDAMKKHGRVFPTDYLSVVRAGEIGGRTGEVFEELADLLERRMEIRSRLQSSLIYPAILVVLALVSLAVIVGGLVPSIAPIFVEGGKTVPAGIQLLVTLGSIWPELLVVTLVAASGLAGAAIVALRRPSTRQASHRLALRIPIFGAILLQQETARFGRTLGTLLKAGVPLVQASTSARSVVGNCHIASGIDAAIESIREGVALHRSLQNETVLPPMALRMISVGEEAGKLDRMLMRVAITFEQQTQRSIDRLMILLTPALTIVIAALVGGLIITVMNAVLSINDLASQ
jgi:general secretion pathway protein F